MKDIFGDRRTILTLLAPALIIYTLVMLVPLLWSLGLTFFQGNPITGFEPAGFANFQTLWEDPRAWSALGLTLRYGLTITICEITLGYLLALLYMFWLRKSSTLIRTLAFFPIVLPTVAVAQLFQKMFEIAPQNGLVNSVIQFFGGDSVDWFSTGATSFVVMVFMDVWRSMGFYGVLLFSGLLDIPEETLESARLDGASGPRLLRYIVLPLSLPVLLAAITYSINGTLKMFDSILALTGGGPGDSTTPLTIYMYRNAFTYGDYGYGSTIALLLTAVCLAFTLALFKATRSDLSRAER